MSYFLPAGTIENGVLVGHDGYLFLAGGSHRVMDIVTGKAPVPPAAYAAFGQNLRGRLEWASKNSCQYLHIIMPDKQSIIPERWPLPDLKMIGAEYLGKHADLAHSIMYPLATLAACKAQAISKVDTHLRDYGSIIMAASLIEKLTGEEPGETRNRLLDGVVTKAAPITGDLGVKLNEPAFDTDEPMTIGPPGPVYSNQVEGGNNGGIDLRFNGTAKYRKRVLFFGDSFGRQIARFLQFWFSEVYFCRSGHFHAEIADLCRPDILLTENVERYLDHPMSDEDRPHFLLYPMMQAKPYAPEPEFVSALSAILSYPRKPYMVFTAPFRAMNPVQVYDGIRLRDRPADAGLLKVVEAPRRVPQKPPDLLLDLSNRGLGLPFNEQQDIHGSFLVRREQVLLFGPNHLAGQDGAWSCESRSFKGQFIDMVKSPSFEANFPGAKPLIETADGGIVLHTAHLADEAVERIAEPVFLATPLEPDNWGRWLATVGPKTLQYKQYGAGRKFLCRVNQPWQRAFLQLWGVGDDAILPHDPGRAYICRDVMTVEYSVTNMTISAAERMMYYEMVATHRRPAGGHHKIFVSRLSQSARHPHYRVLQNEAALASALARMGFIIVEPEKMPLPQQVSLFASAEQIVTLGGAALYNSVFCAPGTSIVTIESSAFFIHPHTQLLSSLGLRYGVIFGTQDVSDPAPVHKKWSLDVERACAAISDFMRG